MSDQLQIDVMGRRAFAPGERVPVAVAWELERAPEVLSLELAWSTEGKGTTDTAAAFRQEWIDGAAGPAGAEVIDVVMPAGPLTRDGKLISIGWALVLRADGAKSEMPIVLQRAGQPWA